MFLTTYIAYTIAYRSSLKVLYQIICVDSG